MIKYQRHEYLKMVMEGTQNQYLHDVDEVCHREVELEVKRIMKKENVTGQLKNENPLEWVQRVNGIKARVEEEIIDSVFLFEDRKVIPIEYDYKNPLINVSQ